MGIQQILNSSVKVGRADGNIGAQNKGQIDRTGGFSVGGTVTTRDATPNPNAGPAAARGGAFPATISGTAADNQLVQAPDTVYIGPVAQGNDFATLADLQAAIVNRRAVTRSQKLRVIFTTGASIAQTWDGTVTSAQVCFECLEFVSAIGTVTITVTGGVFNNAVNVIIGDDISFTVDTGLLAIFGAKVLCLFILGKNAEVLHPDNGAACFTVAGPVIHLGPDASLQLGLLTAGPLVLGDGEASLFAPEGASNTFFNAVLTQGILFNISLNVTSFEIREGLIACCTIIAGTITIDGSVIGSCVQLLNSAFTAGTTLDVIGDGASAFDDNIVARECAFNGNGGPINWTNSNRPIGCSFTGFTLLTITSSNFSPTNCQFNELTGDIVVNSSAAGVGTMSSTGNLWQANRIDMGLDNGASAVVAPFGNVIIQGDRFFTSVPAVNIAGNEGGSFHMSSAILLTGSFVAGVVAPANARFDNAMVVNTQSIANYAQNVTGAGVTNVPNVTNA